MSIVKEFREFAVKGNVVDLAVGIIIGAAFTTVVQSLVNDILMPPLGWVVGNIDFSQLAIHLPVESADGKAVTINYGKFLNAIINFLLVAFAVFLLVKQINRLKRKETPPAPNTKNCPYCISVIDIKATLFFGSYHPVDSDELSFKMAGSMGFRQAFEKAGPILLEPLYNVTVYTPDEYMGDVMGDLNTRRGRVTGMDQAGGLKVVSAQVPLAELYRYSTSLRSMTQGRGTHTRRFNGYEEVPSDLMQKIVEAAKKDAQAE